MTTISTEEAWRDSTGTKIIVDPTFSKASQFRKTSSRWKAGEISPVAFEQAHSKISGNQVV